MADDRLEDVLRRQAITAEKKRMDEEQQIEAAARAEQARQATKALWHEKCQDVELALSDLNARMALNGIQREKRWSESRPAGAIECISIVYSGDRYENSFKRLNINIFPDENVHIRIGTEYQPSKKYYDFPLKEASKAKWLECLVDFIDINTPA